jgi:crotonobetainyl-CoA:carnitine CoA-transferase CaiB-like acyl-CoA transferase
MSQAYLTGTRVIDLSQYIPGPFAALMLADLGADVVKVEPPAGDPLRSHDPAAPGEVSPYYLLMNGNKRVTRIDLKTDGGREAMLALVRAADVLIESYRPGVLARLGLDRGVLANTNPRLIHCAITGYGQNGPCAGKAGHDLNYMALGGGLGLSGTAERPVMTVPPVSDYASAQQAAATILAALVARGRTGKGSYVDLGMVDTVLAWQAGGITAALRGGAQAQRGGGWDSGGLASYNIYRTADGRFLTIGADEDKFWRNFCVAVGRADWEARKQEPAPQTALIAEVQTLIGARDAAHWEALLAGVDCCYQLVLEPAEVLRHPQVEARRMVAVHGGDKPLVEVLYPAWIDGRPPPPRAPYAETDVASVLTAWSGAAAH